MKKYLALFLTVCMAFALCACGTTTNDEATVPPSEEITTDTSEVENNDNNEAKSFTLGSEVFTFGMSIDEVYALASKIGITEEVEVGGLLSSGDNYIVTGSIFYDDGITNCSFAFSAKASGDLDIESKEALNQALLESGTLCGVEVFEYGDGIEFNYLGLDRSSTIDEVETHLTEVGCKSVERYDTSVECYIEGGGSVYFGFDKETMECHSIMLHD